MGSWSIVHINYEDEPARVERGPVTDDSDKHSPALCTTRRTRLSWSGDPLYNCAVCAHREEEIEVHDRTLRYIDGVEVLMCMV